METRTLELTHTTKPRIYVACRAGYNDGILHGAWIDANQEPWAIWAEISTMLARSPIAGAKEYAIHDYEGFAGVRIEEHASTERVAQLAAFIDIHSVLGAEVLAYYGGEIDEAGTALSDCYLGSDGSLADYAQEPTEATVGIPDALRACIDYDAMTRDFELGGDVVSLKLAPGEVHIFAAG